MSRWGREPERIARDLVIACWHPAFDDTDTLDALRALKESRR